MNDLSREDHETSEDRGSLELTDRDIAAFKLIHEQCYLVYDQIRRAFWKGWSVSSKACYSRIRRLIDSGYLKRRLSQRTGVHIHFITEKSLEVLRRRGLDSGIEIYKLTEHFERYIGHDLRVTNLRILFRDLGFTNWTSRRVLCERDRLVCPPDAVLNAHGKRVAVEFENHLTKSKNHYQALFDHYRNHKAYDMLFVIVNGVAKDWLVYLDYDPRYVRIADYIELSKETLDKLLWNECENEKRKGILRLFYRFLSKVFTVAGKFAREFLKKKR